MREKRTNFKKQLAKIAPVCVLSTGFLFGVVNPIFAATKDTPKSQQVAKNSNEDLRNKIFNKINGDAEKALSKAMKNKPELFDYSVGGSGVKTRIDKLTDPYAKDIINNFASYSYGFNVFNNDSAAKAQLEFSGINNTIQITGATDGDTKELANMELLNYHNGGGSEQTYNTVEKSYSTTDSMTYSNQEGVKLGISEAITAEAGVPLIVKGKETTTLSADFKYDHTSGETSSKTITYTFKSQPVKCAPHGTTKFMQSVKQAAFSGTYTGPIKIVEPADYSVVMANKDHKAVGDVYATKGEEGHLLYNTFKYSGDPLPSYLELDDVTKSVIVKDPGATMTFTGQMGFQETANLEFIPDDKSKPSVKIPYAKYMQEQKSGNISKYIEEQIQAKMMKGSVAKFEKN
ncbi:ETX/MTX2 family pore-forming toxin [Bacillus mycoides]|uniref:ETX/MTX2 family pore-forming toxin n=1 Tax=Bacillus mycoides TaxID=1405 RepID=UPI002111E1D5|nr:ETX/MTX2 family pore-forming toxin [Bacillus mycoides]MCQ6530800.1 ETX/MTX2 family pore-forming toxin [Bacillus mycoides]